MSRLSCVLVLLTLVTYSRVANCEQNATATSRGARQMDIPRVVRVYLDQNPHLRRPPPPQISARSDHFPQRIGPGPGPGPYGRPPFGRPPPQPQMSYIRRRVHQGPPGPPPPGVFLRPNGPPPQYNNFQAVKNSRFPVDKGPYVQKGAPVNYYRPGPGQGPVAPNANALPHQQGPNFKPSPIYNGEVIVRHPTAAPLIGIAPSQQSHPQKQLDDTVDVQRQYKAQPNRPALDSPHMYSVYEENENELDSAFPHPNIGENAMKEAKQYLNFMSSSEYFLPKIEPDYRKLDQAKQQQQRQQQTQSAALSTFQQQQQIQQRNSESGSGGLNAAFTVNAPLRVSASSSSSQSQAHQTGSNTNTVSPTSTYPSRHPAQSNLGSYQADSNVFVVNSDGIKNVHHIVPTSSYPESSHQQHKSIATFSSGLRPMVKERVPDPERVEFTERDAIHVSYTSNPMDSISRYGGEKQYQQQLKQQQQQKEHQQQKQHQQQQHQQSQADRRYVNSTPIHEEDDDEMMQASSDIYGRVKVSPTETASNPSIEQKDTEEYCERICSNVQDEDEEVVCGSDGFMYTSEAQMECYASCLHIDVTIQSKGTCNQSL